MGVHRKGARGGHTSGMGEINYEALYNLKGQCHPLLCGNVDGGNRENCFFQIIYLLIYFITVREFEIQPSQTDECWLQRSGEGI